MCVADFFRLAALHPLDRTADRSLLASYFHILFTDPTSLLPATDSDSGTGTERLVVNIHRCPAAWSDPRTDGSVDVDPDSMF